MDFRVDLEGEPSLAATLILLFKGVDLEGVFWRPRDVGAAFEGVFLAILIGVVCAELLRVGVPDTLAERLSPPDPVPRDRSRYE